MISSGFNGYLYVVFTYPKRANCSHQTSTTRQIFHQQSCFEDIRETHPNCFQWDNQLWLQTVCGSQPLKLVCPDCEMQNATIHFVQWLLEIDSRDWRRPNETTQTCHQHFLQRLSLILGHLRTIQYSSGPISKLCNRKDQIFFRFKFSADYLLAGPKVLDSQLPFLRG